MLTLVLIDFPFQTDREFNSEKNDEKAMRLLQWPDTSENPIRGPASVSSREHMKIFIRNILVLLDDIAMPNS